MSGRILILLSLLCSPGLIGCSGEPGTADVQGLPALKKSPQSEENKGVTGMGMDPAEHMMMRLDKNKDNKLEGSEIPEGLPKGYDLDGDGIITKEEIVKRYDRMRKKAKGEDDTDAESKKSAETDVKGESGKTAEKNASPDANDAKEDDSKVESSKPTEKK